MTRQLVVRVEYDGTDFNGWQVQPGLPTVQATLIAALSDVVGAVEVTGASRTDSGVHARDQLATIAFDHRITPHGLCKAVNKRLPTSIAIREPVEMPLDFHVLHVHPSKTYLYRVRTGKTRSPLRDRQVWCVRWPLDVDAMRVAGQCLVGEHDFVSFAAANHGRKTTTRRIYEFDVTVEDEILAWRITGSGFLKQMVRNIMGSLVDVGRGHWTPERFAEALTARARSAAGPTAPSRGLTLERIWWTPADGHLAHAGRE